MKFVSKDGYKAVSLVSAVNRPFAELRPLPLAFPQSRAQRDFEM
jgi:hypothetical protein